LSAGSFSFAFRLALARAAIICSIELEMVDAGFDQSGKPLPQKVVEILKRKEA
jgi:hypothetical protein